MADFPQDGDRIRIRARIHGVPAWLRATVIDRAGSSFLADVDGDTTGQRYTMFLGERGRWWLADGDEPQEVGDRG